MEINDDALRVKLADELKSWPVEKLLGSETGWVRIVKIEIENWTRNATNITFIACIHYDELDSTSCTNPPLSTSRVSRGAWTVNRATGLMQRLVN